MTDDPHFQCRQVEKVTVAVLSPTLANCKWTPEVFRKFREEWAQVIAGEVGPLEPRQILLDVRDVTINSPILSLLCDFARALALDNRKLAVCCTPFAAQVLEINRVQTLFRWWSNLDAAIADLQASSDDPSSPPARR